MSDEAKFVLKQMGVSGFDIKYNTKLLDSLTSRKIETILKTRPLIEKEKKQKILENKTKNLLSKPQETKLTQNPINTNHDSLREEAKKLIEEGSDKYTLGECVKENNIRNPLLSKSFKGIVLTKKGGDI